MCVILTDSTSRNIAGSRNPRARDCYVSLQLAPVPTMPPSHNIGFAGSLGTWGWTCTAVRPGSLSGLKLLSRDWVALCLSINWRSIFDQRAFDYKFLIQVDLTAQHRLHSICKQYSFPVRVFIARVQGYYIIVYAIGSRRRSKLYISLLTARIWSLVRHSLCLFICMKI